MGTVGNQGDAASQQVRPDLTKSNNALTNAYGEAYEESQKGNSQYSVLIK
jgi:hypothetical protein